jgi:hypothetical protein
MIEIYAVILALKTNPRDLNCNTGAPPTAICCEVIKQVRRNPHLNTTTKMILDAYLKHCKGAEFAQKKTTGFGGQAEGEI